MTLWTRALLLAGSVSAAAWYFGRLRPLRSIPYPQPAVTFEDAIGRIERLRAADSERVNPVCRTRLLTHGAKTLRAVALIHGFTSCPAQFERFAEELHASGFNVIVPRLSHHGLSDVMARDVGALSAEEMVAIVCESCDILHGLGEKTTLVGFSMGGALAAWAVQNRPDVDHGVLISPAIGIRAVPISMRRLAANVLLTLPNLFMWWDAKLKENGPGVAHAYPRFATRAVGHLLRVGTIVDAQARRQVYAAGRVTVINNPMDDTVDNRGIDRVVDAWRSKGVMVETYEFPAEWGLVHNIMDPTKPEQQMERVYPKLREWIG